jgi:hypothetical protein
MVPPDEGRKKKEGSHMLRRRLTFSNVVSFLALFVALSAGSYAAIKLPANSVGSKQLKTKAVTNTKLGSNAVSSPKLASNAVTGPKIAADAVDATKVKDGSLTGADINVTGFPKVPLAGAADSAAVSRVKIVTATGTSRASSGDFPVDGATATCDQGLFVVGGGVQVTDVTNQITEDSFPNGNSAWSARVVNGGPGTPGFNVYAICAPAASTQ